MVAGGAHTPELTPSSITAPLRRAASPIVNVLAGKHLKQLLLLWVIESTGMNPRFRVLVRTEQHVPPRDVAVVVPVAIAMVVDSMHFGALEDEANPAGRPDVGVIEELAQRGTQRVDRASLQREPEHRVHEQAADDRVDDHLAGMLVERRDYLQALRTMVDLMESAPQQVVLVAPTVPPIEDKSGDEVRDQAANGGRDMLRKLEQRRPGKPALPRQAGKQHDA